MYTTSLIAIIFFGCPILHIAVYPLRTNKSMDNETIALYEQQGAEYGGFMIYSDRLIEFSSGKDAASKGLPGFLFYKLREGQALKLPPIETPFGLQLSSRHVKETMI